MWHHCKVEQAECAKQTGIGAGVWNQWNRHPESLGQTGEPQQIICCKSLPRHSLNLKVLLTSKALNLYTTLSSTSTTSCFALMFKQKPSNICMMTCDDQLRLFSETLTNWHWMSSVKNSRIHRKWLCMTCLNNKVRTLISVKRNCTLNRDAY